MNNISELEIALLGFIKDNPMHGYAIHNQIMKLTSAGFVWNIKLGRLYQMLDKLQKVGLIRSNEIIQTNRPTKKQYQITEKGLENFNEWKYQPVKRGRDFRIIFLLKLFFAVNEGKEKYDRLIESQIVECDKWIAKRSAGKNLDIDNEVNFELIVNNFRISQIKHYINWLNWCKENLGDD